MALSANATIESRGEGGVVAYAVKPGATIFRGAILGVEAATGLARPLVNGDRRAGIAREYSTGPRVEAYTEGEFLLTSSLDPLSGAEAGVGVYADGDDRMFLTGIPGVDTPLGTITRVVSVNQAWVKLLPFGVAS